MAAEKMPPFARAYMPWVAEWSRCNLSGTQERVMLCLCRWMKREGGRWLSFCPRKDIAQSLGISEASVHEAMRALKRKGLVSVHTAGHTGSATVYVLMPNYRKGCVPDTPIEDEKGVCLGEKGVCVDPLKGCLPDTPTIEALDISTKHPSPTTCDTANPKAPQGEGESIKDVIDRFGGTTWGRP